jgi:hypothetical protein
MPTTVSDWIALGSLIAAALLFVLGLVDLIATWGTKTKIKDAADAAAGVGKKISTDTANAAAKDGNLEDHAALDFSGQWKALAELATALKDLDRSTRLLTLSLAFLAVAGVTESLTAIGEGIAAS